MNLKLLNPKDGAAIETTINSRRIKVGVGEQIDLPIDIANELREKYGFLVIADGKRVNSPDYERLRDEKTRGSLVYKLRHILHI